MEGLLTYSETLTYSEIIYLLLTWIGILGSIPPYPRTLRCAPLRTAKEDVPLDRGRLRSPTGYALAVY